MFAGIKNAGKLFGAILKVPFRYPAMLLPLLLVWLIYAPTVVYLQFYYNWENSTTTQALLVIFAFGFGVSVLLSISCFILLEQIRLIESGQKFSLVAPLPAALHNVWRALPITFLWAVIWFALTVVELLVRRKNERPDRNASPENIARTLAGTGSFSLSGAFFDALKKGVRMIAFLIFPAIAWEKHSKPIQRGLAVARTHKAEFAAGFGLTEIAAAVVFLPPVLIIYAVDKADTTLPDSGWFAIIIYCGFAWSLSMLIEQLFTAELYLWDMKWRRACEKAKSEGVTLPTLGEIPRPSIMDDFAEMADL